MPQQGYTQQYAVSQQQFQPMQPAPQAHQNYGTLPASNVSMGYVNSAPVASTQQYSQGQYAPNYSLLQPTMAPVTQIGHYGQMPPPQQQQQYTPASNPQPYGGSQYGPMPPVLQSQPAPAPQSSNYGVMPPAPNSAAVPRRDSGQLLSAPPATQNYSSIPPLQNPQNHLLPQQNLLAYPPNVSPAAYMSAPPQSNYGEIPTRNSSSSLLAAPPPQQQPRAVTPVPTAAPEISQYGAMPPMLGEAPVAKRDSSPALPSAARIVLAAPQLPPTNAPETQQYGALPPPKQQSAPPVTAGQSSHADGAPETQHYGAIPPLEMKLASTDSQQHRIAVLPVQPPSDENYGSLPPRPASPPSRIEPPSATYGALPAMKADWAPTSNSINPAALVQTQMTEKTTPLLFETPPVSKVSPRGQDDEGAFPMGPPSSQGAVPSQYIPADRVTPSMRSVPSLVLPGGKNGDSSPRHSPRNPSPAPASPRGASAAPSSPRSVSPQPPPRPVSPAPTRPSSAKLAPSAFSQTQVGTANYGEIPQLPEPPSAAASAAPAAPAADAIQRASTTANVPSKPQLKPSVPPRASTKVQLPAIPPRPARRNSSAPEAMVIGPATQHYGKFDDAPPKAQSAVVPGHSEAYSALPPIPAAQSSPALGSSVPAGAAPKGLVLPPIKKAPPPRPKGPPPPGITEPRYLQRQQQNADILGEMSKRLESRAVNDGDHDHSGDGKRHSNSLGSPAAKQFAKHS